MQIFVNGQAKKDFAPDLIRASVTFNFHAGSYDEALRGGVDKVKNYIQQVTYETDFTFEDFKTRAYSVCEQFHTNNLQKRVSSGFFFSQYAYVEFGYNKERLAGLLVLSSRIPNAPRLNINFALRDIEAKKRELIADAYEDAKKKAEVLANTLQKNLRDCVRVEIDPATQDNIYEGDFAMTRSARVGNGGIEQEIKNIDETFKPDDIAVSKQISCVWETSN